MAVANAYTKVGFQSGSPPYISGPNLETVENGVVSAQHLTGLESDRTTALATANPGALMYCTDSGIMYLSLGASGWQFLWAQPVVVTALPASPVDQQQIEYVADAANGVRWRFRYNAGSASAHKWECVANSDIYQEEVTGGSTTSTTYTVVGANTPQITVPFNGDYLVTVGAQSDATGSLTSYQIGATTASDNDAAYNFVSMRTRRQNDLTATTVLAMRHRSVDAASHSFIRRFLMMRPVRIG